MDTREASEHLKRAEEILVSKGATIHGTAAGEILLAVQSLIENLDNSFGSVKPMRKTATGYKAD